MATARDVLNIARNDLGYKESPAGSNRTKYGEWYGLNGQPWCMMAIQFWLNQAGVPVPLKTASCGSFMRAAQAHGQWVTGNYQPGDIVIMDFPGNKFRTDHCGIVVTALTDGVRTIEGNTGVGNDSNGGEVMERTRPLSGIVGAYRPHYAEETAKKEDKPMTYKYLNDIPEKFRPMINLLMIAGII